MDHNFARGARIKPKEPKQPDMPINEAISFPEFMALVGMYAAKDFGVSRERFLRYAEVAFDGAMRAISASEPQHE
jgi:hypothetical protein